MDLSDLRKALEAAGVRLSAEGERIRAEPSGPLTEAMRAAIRTHRWQLLAGLESRAEAGRLLTMLGCGPAHPDHAEALALGLNDPAHVECWRASAGLEGLS